MSSATSSAIGDRLAAPGDRRWLILVVVAVAQLMVVLDATIVNIALPSAQQALGFANSERQWVVTAYALAFGSLLLVGGRLGDMFSRKQVFITGLIGFAIASALGGAAVSFGMLVAARALQGAFGAILAPAALGTLVSTFQDPLERGRAFGVFGSVAAGGGAVGLILGGVLTQYLSWRWCLYVNLGFAAIAVAGALAWIRSSRPGARPPMDWPGAVLACAGLFLIVFGFSHAETAGWTAALTIGSLVGGVVLLAGFVFAEQRASHPLLPLRVILDRTRGGSYVAVGISGIAIFGTFLFLTYYLQVVKAESPLTTGLLFLPMIGCILLSSNLSSIALLPRLGPAAARVVAGEFGRVVTHRFDVRRIVNRQLVEKIRILPLVRKHVEDQRRHLVPSWVLRVVLASLRAMDGRHLAIVRYRPDHEILEEWVYNEADIDGSSVVWARDMGAAKNQELIDYYKDRRVWLVEPDEKPVRVTPHPPDLSSAGPV
jgi:MFS family permease